LSASASFSRWLKSIIGIVFIGFGAKLASLENN
jgi:threonine/homoserine/homoserine lactone efflux protein